MGTLLRVPSKTFPMNTNMTRLGWFSKNLCPCALDESSLSIGRVISLLKELVRLFKNVLINTESLS